MAYDAVVTDGSQRVALEIVRCLGRAGLSVALVEQEGTSNPLTFASGFVDETRLIEDYGDPSFSSLVEQSRAVIPVSTNTHYEFYEENLHNSDAIFLTGPDTFRTVNNKSELVRIAEQLSVPTPDTTVVPSGDSNRDVEVSGRFPGIVKLADDRGLYLPPSRRYKVVTNETQLNEAIDRLGQFDKPLLFQEFISGTGFGYSGFFRDGSCVHGIAHRRNREYPPSGGPSTDCERVHHADLEEHATTLMEHLGWDGPAMVEFRRRQETGTFYLMEVNPRYWGSLPLARACGMNIPRAHYRAITGETTSDLSNSGTDTGRVKFLFMDVASVGESLWSGQMDSQDFLSWVWDLLTGSYSLGLIDASDMRPVGRYLFNKCVGFTGSHTQ